MLRVRVVVYNKLRYRTLNIKREFNLEVASFSGSRRQITGDMAVRLITMAVILISSYSGHNMKIVSSNKCILLDKREGSVQSGEKYEYEDEGVGGGGEGHKEQSKSCCFFPNCSLPSRKNNFCIQESAELCESKMDLRSYLFLNRVCEDFFQLYRDTDVYSACR